MTSGSAHSGEEQPDPGLPDRASPARRHVAPSRLHWLERELLTWQHDGLLTEATAAAIRSRYVVGTRVALVRVVVGLGAAFLAVGLLWLVATNLDRFDPLVRLAAVTAVWLGLAGVAEALAARAARPPGPGRPGEHAADPSGAQDGPGPTLASVCHVLAAAAFGAVIFQAAQSLQVPAFEARLAGAWALGALAYALATASRGAQAIGIAAGVLWFGWLVKDYAGEDALVGIAMVLAAGCAATAIGVAHAALLARRRPGFDDAWRVVGAGLALAGVFFAALPFDWGRATRWSPVPLTFVGVAVGLAVAGVALAALRRGAAGPRLLTAESGVAMALVGLGFGLGAWRPEQPPTDAPLPAISAEMWLHAGAGLLLFIAAAAWYALLGAHREQPVLTAVALVGLVLFTTVQSFAVFAPIISGATLFLAVGAVMVATGLLADRFRRLLDRRRSRAAAADGGAS